MNTVRAADRTWLEILRHLSRYRDFMRSSDPDVRLAARPEENTLREIYLPLVGGPGLVIAQLGQTLDGRIATGSGDSRFVTGPEDIVHLHRLRALVDAVIVGAGTVVADDPRLTVREVPGLSPVRVVLDPAGRIPGSARIFCDGAAPTIRILALESSETGVESSGFETLRLPLGADGGFAPADILNALRQRGILRVLVEGGGITVSRFLAASALDRLHVTVAPLLLGSGRPSLTLPPVDRLDQALRAPCRHFALGPDMLFDLCLRS